MALTSAQRQIADALSHKQNMPIPRGGSADNNPVWQSPTPAGSAKPKTVTTFPVKYPSNLKTTPQTTWFPTTGSAQSPSSASAFIGDRLAPDPYQYADNDSRYLPGAGAPPTKVASAAPVPLNRPSAFATHMDDPAYAAAYLKQFGVPPPTAVAADLDVMPPRPATQAIPPNLQAILAQNPMYIGTVRGGQPAPVMRPAPRIAANALIDGKRGKDNAPGANYMGRSVGSDGVVRAYNQATKQYENLSQNSKKSPSQSYSKDRHGDRDMRQTRKPGPGR